MNSPSDQENVVELIADILQRRGNEAYLGEAVTMSEHMLQTAHLAECAGDSEEIVVASLLHDIGHFTGEFGDDYLEKGVDNFHQHAGARILESRFPANISAAARWHVDAKRYLCAIDRGYYENLSEASVVSLKLQGGPFTEQECRAFEQQEGFDVAVHVRRYDDEAKVPGKVTPPLSHYLPMIEKLVIADRN